MNGTPAAGRITCASCGGLNPEISRFCNRCGARLATDGAAARPAALTANPRAASVEPPPEPSAVRAAQGPQDAPRPAAAAPRGRKICPGCHRFNPATAKFCTDCGVTLPLDSAVPVFGGPAGFWIRLVAAFIDNLLLSGVQVALDDRMGVPSSAALDRMPLEQALLAVVPAMLLGLAIFCLYEMIMVGTWGGTAGKLMLGLRIVRHSDGGKVPYGLALGRSLAAIISFIPFGLGYLWIALSPSKRGWHDYLCDTRVVRARAE
jgi:uncharacterized RDD family membrane protein YckC